MSTMILNSNNINRDTPVSNIFIDRYMRDSNGEFVKVYLYLLRCSASAVEPVTLTEIADRLNLTEKDIIRALKYWVKVNILSVEFDEGTKEPVSINFLPFDTAYSDEYHSGSQTGNIHNEAVQTNTITQNEVAAASEPAKHNYSPSELKRLRERDEIKQLLYIVEKYIGKPLTGTEINTLLYFNEGLGFSSELIEYLVEYCVSNQHTSLRYMEKVAVAWYDKGILSISDAKESTSMGNKRTSVVVKALGIANRTLTAVEMDYINRWYDEYGFDKEIIIEACKRTILSTGKASFSYTEGILKKWHKSQIHTLDEVRKYDAGFRAKITVPVGTMSAPAKSTNKFNNFSQRTYDFDEIEKNLISNNK